MCPRPIPAALALLAPMVAISTPASAAGDHLDAPLWLHPSAAVPVSVEAGLLADPPGTAQVVACWEGPAGAAAGAPPADPATRLRLELDLDGDGQAEHTASFHLPGAGAAPEVTWTGTGAGKGPSPLAPTGWIALGEGAAAYAGVLPTTKGPPCWATALRLPLSLLAPGPSSPSARRSLVARAAAYRLAPAVLPADALRDAGRWVRVSLQGSPSATLALPDGRD